MTIEERNNKLKCLITCMKCETSGKLCNPNCPTQYDAGCMGEIIENLEEISKLLEQVPIMNKSCVARQICRENKVKVVNKIYAEIQKLSDCCCGCSEGLINEVLEIIDKYRTEGESKEVILLYADTDSVKK